jgi:putative tricarboxylic transport membrane protein
MFANVFLFFIGILLTPLFVAVIRVEKQILIPIVILLSIVGTFALEASIFDLWIMLGFGLVGYVLRKFDYPLAPIVIGAVLGPICESNFRRSLVISGDDYGIFIERPLAATILAIDLLLLIWVATPDGAKAWAKRTLAGTLGTKRDG